MNKLKEFILNNRIFSKCSKEEQKAILSELERVEELAECDRAENLERSCERHLMTLKQLIYESSQGCLKPDECIEIQTFRQLINERFDNPPLKFEELEKWQWVWDSKTQNYAKVFDLFIDEKGRKTINIKWGMDYFRIEFEENRFYRKQVSENEI